MGERQPTGQDLWAAHPVVAGIRKAWAEIGRSGYGRVMFVTKPTVSAGGTSSPRSPPTCPPRPRRPTSASRPGGRAALGSQTP
jgi:hypothetical protein